MRLHLPHFLWLLSIALSVLNLARAGEYAVFASGRRLHIDRHEEAGPQVKLFLGSGSIQVERTDVCGFELDDITPATPQTPAAPPPAALSPRQLADQAARKYGLPPALVRGVMKAESGFQPQAVSTKGAIGLMQLMPATAARLGADPRDPAQNADAGARYLRDLLEQYHGALWHALAAYNAGPGAVEKYHGVPPYPETLNYVRRVQQEWKQGE